MRTRLVIIQPTSFCNINCRYCYLPQRALTRRMSKETLEQIFKVLLSSSLVGDAITCIWHASEPLTLPMSFYEQAFALQQRWNVQQVRITNAFQTNATLINQRWCDFFKQHAIQIGVSIDGPQYIHDANRIDKQGHGTFERANRGVALLQANAIRFSIIAVITEDAARHPDEMWQFFADLRPTRLGLNPEEVEGINVQSSLRTDEHLQLYKKFIQRLLTLNTQSKQPLRIREIDFLMRRLQSDTEDIRSQTNVPLATLSFDYAGNVSTFSPELLTITHPDYQTFHFGNVYDGSLEAIQTNPRFIAINGQIQRGVARCRETCEYFLFCGGGSPSNKLHENGTFASTETVACRLRVKATTDVLLEHLEDMYYIAPPQDDDGGEMY